MILREKRQSPLTVRLHHSAVQPLCSARMENPDEVAASIKERIGFDTLIVDINDLDGSIFGKLGQRS